jgi:hypothetical protein
MSGNFSQLNWRVLATNRDVDHGGDEGETENAMTIRKRKTDAEKRREAAKQGLTRYNTGKRCGTTQNIGRAVRLCPDR